MASDSTMTLEGEQSISSDENQSKKNTTESEEQSADNSAIVAASRCSSGFEKEYKLASDFRDAVEFIIARCFSYLRFETFVKAFPDVKDHDYLGKLHKELLSSLHDFITETVSELFHQKGVIQSLNDLHQMIENQPLTFRDVWRPSGDPYKDIVKHTAGVCERYQKKFSEMLQAIKQDNKRKEAEMKRLEKQILSLRNEIKSCCNKIKKQALAAD